MDIVFLVSQNLVKIKALPTFSLLLLIKVMLLIIYFCEYLELKYQISIYNKYITKRKKLEIENICPTPATTRTTPTAWR